MPLFLKQHHTHTLWTTPNQHRAGSNRDIGKMRARDDLRSRDPTSPALPEMNDEITRTTNEHKRQKWRQFVETLDHKTDPTKLWRTIKAIDGRSTPKAENEAITFDGSQVTSQSRSPTTSIDSSPLQSWADTLLPGIPD